MPLRPELSLGLSESDFRRWYWLKSELLEFCRDNGVPSSGGKEAVASRIAARLANRDFEEVNKNPLSLQSNDIYTLSTVVCPGFKLSKKLREFFVLHIGEKFCFNQSLRDFFKSPNQRTLADAISIYRVSLKLPKQEIAGQFEYNRHMRSFFESHPGATIHDARKAWWEKREKAKDL